jgi:hypothetical protein
VRLCHPHQGGAQPRGFAGIDRDSGAAAGHFHRVHVVDPPFAFDHYRQSGIEFCIVVERAGKIVAVGRVEQFQVARDRIIDVVGFGRFGVSRIGEAQPAAGAPGPDRPGCCDSEAA